MNVTIKSIGQNVNGENTYRVYPRDYHLDIGDVIKRSPRRWCAWPAIRGEMLPWSEVAHFLTRRESVEYIIHRASDGNIG